MRTLTLQSVRRGVSKSFLAVVILAVYSLGLAQNGLSVRLDAGDGVTPARLAPVLVQVVAVLDAPSGEEGQQARGNGGVCLASAQATMSSRVRDCLLR